MADAVATQILEDGKRNAVIKFTNVSDGTGEAAVTKVTPSALQGAPTMVVIRRIKASTFGMGVDILWDATADVLAWHVPTDADINQDFTFGGGLVLPAAAGRTGLIQFTTVGHAAGDRYSIVLELIKKFGAL
jgi:hypothetical protein